MTRREILASATAVAACAQIATAREFTARESTTRESKAKDPAGNDNTADIAAMAARAYTALMKGDAATYAATLKHTRDYTLMQPFGGKVVHGFDMAPEHLARLGGFFRNGDFRQEIVKSIRSEDVVVLVTIERQSVEVGGLAMQEWPLRVTLVFHKDEGEWKLAHRHADPLVNGISVEHAAAIARNDIGHQTPAKR